jgi:hypothetical protein
MAESLSRPILSYEALRRRAGDRPTSVARYVPRREERGIVPMAPQSQALGRHQVSATSSWGGSAGRGRLSGIEEAPQVASVHTTWRTANTNARVKGE